ncbi:outer membrane beta-barrel protein [Dawidia soli]|uniref:Outer membrane beta-barrel protein n=1 Tax=Dawidia soli TaxID=2782352 RepID=A0AAP2DCP9_9BACT|nr:outer membrane beta-barrel protein [Dawidia soli]MBT1688390.1 outer membrane beta-barrel protein [Dawidia soli]
MLLALGSLTKVFSQADYRPGYIVSLQGDTLRGSIDYRNWLRNPKAISFHPSAQGEDRTYTPLEIRAFGVAGDIYESAIVQVDVSPTDVGELSESPEPQLVADTAFIRALITGEKSLYLYHTADQRGKNEQLYIRKDGQWELLIYKKYIRKQTTTGTQEFVTSNNRYIKQLAFYLQACPSIQKKMRDIRYGSTSLERLFRTYYECTTTTPAYEKKPEKRPVEFGILAGAAQTSVDIRTIDRLAASPLAQASFPKGFTFTGGLFLDLVRLRNNRKWSLNSELVYTSFTSEGTHYEQRNADSYTYTYINLEYSYLKLNTLVRFKYPVGKLYLFANAGISSAIVLQGSDRQTEVRYFQNTPTVHESKAFDNGTESYDLGFLGGLGVRYQRYAFETRFERTQGMINYTGMSARLTRVAFLLSFRLSK